MIRFIISACVEGVIKRLSGAGLIDIESREYFQHYGFTSRPLPGGEAIAVADGNHIVIVASDDRRYRIALEKGEAALYTDEGDKVHLKRGRVIEIVGGEKIVADTKAAEVTASVSATVTAPEINLGGDRGTLLSLIDERILALLNSHTHEGVTPGTGVSGPMSQPITVAQVGTVKTKAA